MNNLHVAAPQPFLGRYLRYEPARAFRTLLISYRCVIFLLQKILKYMHAQRRIYARPGFKPV